MKMMQILPEEAQLIATALNNAKINSYRPDQQQAVASLGRRLSNYLADGLPDGDPQTREKRERKPNSGPTKIRLSITAPTSTDPDMATLYRQVFGD